MIVAESNITPDTVSLNTVLKAWNRCCNSLSQTSRNNKQLPTDYNHSVDVYTPRDAATRATTLLLQQEQSDTAKPDVQSFNIVMGKLIFHFFLLHLGYSNLN